MTIHAKTMKIKICFVVASPITAKSFLKDHILALSEHYDVSLIANFSSHQDSQKSFSEIKTLDVPINRKISILKDFKALFILAKIFQREGFTSVHSVTPKAGLLTMLAGLLAGTPKRFHIFTGQVWATQSGLYRKLLKFLDKITFFAATTVLVDSQSQRDFLIHEGVINSNRSSVLANGSITGVDVSRFSPSNIARSSIRFDYKLPENAFIFLFLGRINTEKGITELVRAFLNSGCSERGGVLMLVGPEEDNVLSKVRSELAKLGAAFIRVGFTDQPQNYMAAADVFCLPSHREGFGSVHASRRRSRSRRDDRPGPDSACSRRIQVLSRSVPVPQRSWPGSRRETAAARPASPDCGRA